MAQLLLNYFRFVILHLIHFILNPICYILIDIFIQGAKSSFLTILTNIFSAQMSLACLKDIGISLTLSAVSVSAWRMNAHMIQPSPSLLCYRSCSHYIISKYTTSGSHSAIGSADLTYLLCICTSLLNTILTTQLEPLGTALPMSQQCLHLIGKLKHNEIKL